MTSKLSPEEIERYHRHILLKEIGGPGQQRLKAARVALVGLGGLGAPAALYLAAAGIGELILIDDDEVSLSNLQRQVLYQTDECGDLKAQKAKERLQAINPNVQITVRVERLEEGNAGELLNDVDLVLDGSDSFATRFAVNAAAHALNIPLISGAAQSWQGQIALFDFSPEKRETNPCYRCFVPEAPETEESCDEIGVIGPATGIVGARMALEAVKFITRQSLKLAGRLWIFDALTGRERTVKLVKDRECPVCGFS